MMKTKYSFGMCKVCGKNRSLKNNICASCENKVERKSSTEMPEFFKKIFENK